MKKIALFLIVLTFAFTAQAQLTKGNWIIGGNATYSKNASKGTDAGNSKIRALDILGNIGYFPLPKFATGLILNTLFTKQKLPQSNTGSTQNNLGGGVFIRYYFLKESNRINVFTDEGLVYSVLKTKTAGTHFNDFKSLSYYFSAGTVVFVNSSVGAEFIVSYNRSKAVKFDSRGETLQFRVGLQFYLENQ